MMLTKCDFCRAEDRCRHYMIDQTSAGKYVILGEPKVHRTLKHMVEYLQRVSQIDVEIFYRNLKTNNTTYVLLISICAKMSEVIFLSEETDNFYYY